MRARVQQLFEVEDVEKWTGRLVVATDRKLRVHPRQSKGAQS